MLPKFIDSFNFRSKKLKNGLRTLTITEKLTKTSCFALSIRTGTLLNNFDGISKLLERVVFYGKDCKNELNPFQTFIYENYGACRSDTTEDTTNFYFEIETSLFEQALVLFIQLINKPFFEDSSIQNEIKEIEALYQRDKKRDSVRFKQLILILSEMNWFGFGNASSWNVDGIKNKLVDFYKLHYDSSKSNVAIYHNNKKLKNETMLRLNQLLGVKTTGIKKTLEPCEPNNLNSSNKDNIPNYVDQKDTVTEKSLKTPPSDDKLENKMIKLKKKKQYYKPFKYDDVIYEKFLPREYVKDRMVYVESNTRHKVLRLYIEVPKVQTIYKNNSLDYIIFMLNRKDEHSLYSNLYRRQFITKLKSRLHSNWFISMLSVEIVLTDEGYLHVPRILEIIKANFGKIEISEKIYQKLKQIKQKKLFEKKFNCFFKNITKYAQNLHMYPPKHIIEHECMFRKFFDREIVYLRDIISNNSNWLSILSSKNILNELLVSKNEDEAKYINDCIAGLATFEKINKIENKNLLDDNVEIDRIFGLRYVVGAKVQINNSLNEMSFYSDKYACKFIKSHPYKEDIVYMSVLLNTKPTEIQTSYSEIYICMLIENFKQKHFSKMYLNGAKIRYKMTYSGVELTFSSFSASLISIVALFFENFWVIDKSLFYNVKYSLINKYNAKFKLSNYKKIKINFINNVLKNFSSIKKRLKTLQRVKLSDVTFPKECFIDMIVCGNDQPELYNDLAKKIHQYFTPVPKFIPENQKLICKTLRSFKNNDNICFMAIKCGKINDIKKMAIYQLFLDYSWIFTFLSFQKPEFFDRCFKNDLMCIGDMFYIYFYLESQAGIEFLERELRNYITDINEQWNNITETELMMAKHRYNRFRKKNKIFTKSFFKQQAKHHYSGIKSISYIDELNTLIEHLEIKDTKIYFGDINVIKCPSKSVKTTISKNS